MKVIANMYSPLAWRASKGEMKTKLSGDKYPEYGEKYKRLRWQEVPFHKEQILVDGAMTHLWGPETFPSALLNAQGEIAQRRQKHIHFCPPKTNCSPTATAHAPYQLPRFQSTFHLVLDTIKQRFGAVMP